MLFKFTIYRIKMFVRDKLALFWTIVFPLLFVFIFCGILGRSGEFKLSVALVIEDSGPIVNELVQGLEKGGIFTLKKGIDFEEAKENVEKGRIDAILVIPKNFSSSLFAGGASLIVYYDKTRTQNAQIVSSVFQQLALEISKKTLGLKKFPIEVNLEGITRKRSIENASYSAFFIPGALTMALMAMGLFGVGGGIPREREKGLLRKLATTPLRRLSYGLAFVFQSAILALLQAVIIIGIGASVFKVNFLIRPLDLVIILVLGGVTFASLGFLIGSIAKRSSSAEGLVNVFYFPMMFLSPVFFPASLLPPIIRKISNILPSTYLVGVLRKSLIIGSSFKQIFPDLLGLGAWILGTAILASFIFRWTEER
ncbi:ABC transporter permease [Candidatus Aerophobetes bacterium]|nr:ABC transporter permease [Candidatus Aerophobetes bacterium]